MFSRIKTPSAFHLSLSLSMEKLVWMLFVLLPFQIFEAASKDASEWLNIDCGSDNRRFADNRIWWETDAGFTITGVNKGLQQTQLLQEMNALRFFPDRKQQNCYNLPMNVPFDLRYLIRAGFYDGDYDGHSRPPTFDLHLDGKKWSTVNTSSSIGQPIYHEAYYRAHWPGQISVCLVQTRHGEVPFISSLEAVPLSDDLYSHMKTNSTFLLVTRTILGAPEIRDDAYDRIWTSGAIPPNTIQVSTTQYSTSTTENDPPLPVLMSNIQSPTPSDPIILSVDLPQVTPQSAYFVFYLTDVMPRESFGDTRIVDIYIDGQKRVTVFSYQFSCYGVTIYPVILVGPTVNVTLAATNESTLPPIITAMEIFTRADQSPSSNDTHEHLSPMYLRLVLIYLLSWLF